MTAMIAKSLSFDRSATHFNVGLDLQSAQGAQGVAWQIHARTGIAPVRIAFNDVRKTSASP
jgi:hypothetical protein